MRFIPGEEKGELLGSDDLLREFDNPYGTAIYCWQDLLSGDNLVIERPSRQPANAEEPIVFVVDEMNRCARRSEACVDRSVSGSRRSARPRTCCEASFPTWQAASCSTSDYRE